VDRLVLNGYFALGQQGGGFRHWWRKLTGSDETLDREHLLRMAGRFGRRVHAYAKHHQIPLLDCEPGVRKHELAEQHRPPRPELHGAVPALGRVGDEASSRGAARGDRPRPPRAWSFVNLE
jgi:hypothetical protein